MGCVAGLDQIIDEILAETGDGLEPPRTVLGSNNWPHIPETTACLHIQGLRDGSQTAYIKCWLRQSQTTGTAVLQRQSYCYGYKHTTLHM